MEYPLKKEIMSRVWRRAVKHGASNGRARRRGNIVVIVAGSMLGLLGFAALAVDYGLLVSDKNQLQRACDAAALAGASQLKTTNDDTFDTGQARALAVTVAMQNGATVDAATITFLNNNTEIRVPSTKVRTLHMAQAIGIPTATVSAAAIAGVKAADMTYSTVGPNRVVPIGVSWETYNTYKGTGGTLSLKLIQPNKSAFGFNDYVLMDLRGPNSKSPAHMLDQAAGTELQTSHIGDYETALNAELDSEARKLQQGANSLFAKSALSPWYDSSTVGVRYNDIVAGTSPRDNPRVVNFIITPSTTISNGGGSFNTEVQGFVQVYLESVDMDGTQLNVRFLPPATSSDGQVGVAPGNVPLSGTRIIQLLQ